MKYEMNQIQIIKCINMKSHHKNLSFANKKNQINIIIIKLGSSLSHFQSAWIEKLNCVFIQKNTN